MRETQRSRMTDWMVGDKRERKKWSGEGVFERKERTMDRVRGGDGGGRKHERQHGGGKGVEKKEESKREERAEEQGVG